MATPRASKTSETRIERGSGNVYADLDRPDADAQLLKAELVSRIDEIIRQRCLTQAQAAELLGSLSPTSHACSEGSSGTIPSSDSCAC